MACHEGKNIVSPISFTVSMLDRLHVLNNNYRRHVSNYRLVESEGM